MSAGFIFGAAAEGVIGKLLVKPAALFKKRSQGSIGAERKKSEGMLDINGILAQVDGFYEENKGEEAEKLLLQSIGQAVSERDDTGLLHLLNELLGYYRETGQKANAMKIAGQTVEQAKRMGLQGTIPYATTLLNVANACRACGELEDSMAYYLQVQEIYDRQLTADDMYVAGLKNNMSLLYQEMGDFKKAKEMLTGALAIVSKKQVPYELGVTYANLAGTCMGLGEISEAYEYAVKAMEVFEGANVTDSHYAAAIATLGAFYYRNKEYEKALQYYCQASDTVEKSLGHNEYYRRLQAYVADCERALDARGQEPEACRQARQEKDKEPGGRIENVGLYCEAGSRDLRHEEDQGGENRNTDQENGKLNGLGLARAYYEAFGRKMIKEMFPDYVSRVAVGLSGRGSDCLGYDDGASRDHDWGPDFCMWITDETYGEIGEALQRAYEALPKEFMGCQRAPHVNGRNRRGVIKISEFYRDLTGAEVYEQIDWSQVSDASLAAAVSGEVFWDEEDVFSAYRRKLQQGYPEAVRYLKLAESGARFAQTAQYNYARMRGRGDDITACMMVWDGVREAMRLEHYIEGKYPPHDKWLYRSLRESEEGREVAGLVEQIKESLYDNRDTGLTDDLIERLGAYFAMKMYREGYISDTESYLDAHSEELVYKAALAAKGDEALVEEIARLEFEAFDKVKNEGGRASCQNDWPTFSIMRKSQYLTWNRGMLLQYLYDFRREYQRGHNLIEEKYGRMMESTAPEEFEKIKSHFPELSEEKKAIIEQIVGLQVAWMEDFAKRYPALADNARTIHTREDRAFDTSYETYLRGELGTYSDKMLELYGRYVVSYAQKGTNLADDIMTNSVKMYGYKSMEEADRKIAEAWA